MASGLGNLVGCIAIAVIGLGASGSASAMAAGSGSGAVHDRAISAQEGGGIRARKGDVLFGNPRRSKQPAVVEMDQALAATPEGRRIDDEGIQKGSARYNILMSKAHARVRKAVKVVAVAAGRDCVVKKGAITENPSRLEVADLTSDVVAALQG